MDKSNTEKRFPKKGLRAKLPTIAVQEGQQNIPLSANAYSIFEEDGKML